MKAAKLTYHRADSLDSAHAIDRLHQGAGKFMAGGQSLMPMMNFLYVMPDHLIDLNKVGELAYLRFDAAALHIGAMTRQRELEFSAEIGERCPILHEAL
ncbi:xanthine dehydrogenase family protein subunit M, partial [Lacisediminimonas sp.]|uniref:FAD binding domain-containing protein n=1 Tax=Lacisediminimonas sp. TaxID=3060582 RepID=UPI002716FABD